jgi:hypothetical protein
MAAAVEPRLRVLAPVNMISAHFQGGCICENAPGLRTQTHNVEIAALAAPRPMLMVSATGDWTANTPAVEYPAVRDVYRSYDAEDYLAWAQVDAGHNYNAASRAHVYRWFARWFLGDAALGDDAERPFAVEPDERLRIYPVSQRPAPADAAALEAGFQRRANERMERLRPADAESRAELIRVTQTRLRHTLGVEVPDAGEVIAWEGEELPRGSWSERPLALGRAGRGDRVRATLFAPRAGAQRSVLVAHGAGLAGLQDAFGGADPLVRELLDAGYCVLALEALYTGAVPADALPPQTGDWFEATFNPPLLGRRVQDLLTGLAYLERWLPARPVSLLGLGQAGPWALLAGALSETPWQVYADVSSAGALDEACDVPGWNAFGGLPVVSACLARRRLLLGGVCRGWDLAWAQRSYAIDAPDALEVLGTLPAPRQIATWLAAP